jgi:hypothetical protein
MCRNYEEYKWKPCWSQIGTFQKFVPELFSKIVTLQVEDGAKRKTLQLQSCRKFHGERSEHKIHLIPSPNGRDKPAPLRSKMGRRKSKRLYKGRNPSSVGDTSTHKFVATRATFSPPPWIPSPWGRAPMKPWSKGAKGRRFPMIPAAGKESPAPSPAPPPLPAPSLLLSTIITAIFITYTVVHPPTHLCTILYKHDVWCYNIYPMIYVMFL